MGAGSSKSLPTTPSSRGSSPRTRPRTKNRHGVGVELLCILGNAKTLSPNKQPIRLPSEVSTLASSEEFAMTASVDSTLAINKDSALASEGSILASIDGSAMASSEEPVMEHVKLFPAVFQWERKARSVYLAGSFDNWATKIPLAQSNESFYTILNLPQGEHYYLYCVNGDWRCSDNQEKRNFSNKQQTNYVEVKAEYEIYAALAVDWQAEAYESLKFDQEIPKKTPGWRDKPPLLPHQMMQIIVNKDIPGEADPELLPPPDHVMLNHLYVMVKGHDEKKGGEVKEKKSKKEKKVKKEKAKKEKKVKKELAEDIEQAEEIEQVEEIELAEEAEQIPDLSQVLDIDNLKDFKRQAYYTTFRFRSVCVTTVYYC